MLKAKHLRLDVYWKVWLAHKTRPSTFSDRSKRKFADNNNMFIVLTSWPCDECKNNRLILSAWFYRIFIAIMNVPIRRISHFPPVETAKFENLLNWENTLLRRSRSVMKIPEDKGYGSLFYNLGLDLWSRVEYV